MASSTFQSPTSPANASQAQQEAGSSTSVYVSPGVQQFHPSASKAWAMIAWSAGTPSLSASYNVTSVTDTDVGRVTVNFTTAFSSANYAGATSCASVNSFHQIEVASKATSSCLVRCVRSTTGAFTDPDNADVILMGDQ